jgi:hypothetical protein
LNTALRVDALAKPALLALDASTLTDLRHEVVAFAAGYGAGVCRDSEVMRFILGFDSCVRDFPAILNKLKERTGLEKLTSVFGFDADIAYVMRAWFTEMAKFPTGWRYDKDDDFHARMTVAAFSYWKDGTTDKTAEVFECMCENWARERLSPAQCARCALQTIRVASERHWDCKFTRPQDFLLAAEQVLSPDETIASCAVELFRTMYKREKRRTGKRAERRAFPTERIRAFYELFL